MNLRQASSRAAWLLEFALQPKLNEGHRISSDFRAVVSAQQPHCGHRHGVPELVEFATQCGDLI